MLPISYFNPVHKPRKTVNQDVNIRAKRKGINNVFDGSSENQILRDEDVDELISERELIVGNVIPYTSAEGREASKPSPEVHEGFADSKLSSSQKALDHSLKNLRPPLLGPQNYPSLGARVGQNTNANSARQRHLAVLTAIMHRSLLQYNYFRAARAWSMILRSELDGHSVDLRNGYRWGLGAEIMLQQSKQPFQASYWTSDVFDVDSNALEGSSEHLSSAQLDRLKEYYNRLSLQYPFHKSSPDRIGPLDFHSAFFSLSIYACANRTTQHADGHAAINNQDKQRTKDTTTEVLRWAREISEELVELISSPPYSDSERFKSLKIMVDRWKADLVVANVGIGPLSAPDVQSDRSNNGFSVDAFLPPGTPFH